LGSLVLKFIFIFYLNVVAPFAENLFVDIPPFVVLVVDIHFSFGDTLCVDIRPYDIHIAEDIVLSFVDARPSFVGGLLVDILPSSVGGLLVDIPPSSEGNLFADIPPSSEGNLFAGILPSFEGSLVVDIPPSFEDNPFADIPQKIVVYLSIFISPSYIVHNSVCPFG
jgi:hypothetical protein